MRLSRRGRGWGGRKSRGRRRTCSSASYGTTRGPSGRRRHRSGWRKYSKAKVKRQKVGVVGLDLERIEDLMKKLVVLAVVVVMVGMTAPAARAYVEAPFTL